MGSPRLMWLLIAIPLIGMFMGVTSVWWSTLGSHYGYPSDDTGNNLSVYNKLDEINNDMKDVKERTTSITEEQGAVDRLGNFFSNAYSILMTIPKSFDILFDFINISILNIPMGESGAIINITLQTILIITIFIGIILAILLKFTT